MSIKRVVLILSLFSVAIFFVIPFTNEKLNSSFTHSYHDGRYQENIDITMHGMTYEYHHYFTDNTGRMIFNQDVSGIFWNIGNYHFTYPFKINCYSGCGTGISITESSLFNVFYKKTIDDICKSELLLFPARGVATIDAHKQVLSSLLINEHF